MRLNNVAPFWGPGVVQQTAFRLYEYNIRCDACAHSAFRYAGGELLAEVWGRQRMLCAENLWNDFIFHLYQST